MVNHGPSKGCATCRLRRVKCDEGLPACSRCTKAKRLCLGYGDSSAAARSSTMATVSTGSASSTSSVSGEALSDHVSEVVTAGLQSLQASSQTHEERRALHRQYQAALRDLRDTVASSPTLQDPASSACMLALYEVRLAHHRYAYETDGARVLIDDCQS